MQYLDHSYKSRIIQPVRIHNEAKVQRRGETLSYRATGVEEEFNLKLLSVQALPFLSCSFQHQIAN